MNSLSKHVKIAGKPWPSFPAILALVCYLFCLIFMFWPGNSWQGRLASVSLIGLTFYATGKGMFYFLISDHQLIVRNHSFFWFCKIYDFSEISRTGFTKTGKRLNIKAFFIAAKKPRYKVFAAQHFNKSDWNELKEIITSKSIPFSESAGKSNQNA
jgi:hypothetical protein